MIKDYEIERKFLVEYPEISELDVRKYAAICQTYLKNDENQNQRRVRKFESDGNVTYTYTEKLFITAVTRKEMEYKIDEQEYLRLVTQAKDECVPVNKVRYWFNYQNQMFELDTYPFSDKLAILELELENAEQKIFFPDNINVIREVTEDRKYSNSALALAGAFPEEQ
jgi:CYTH domain-containing protein